MEKISRELGLFQHDVRELPTSSVKKLKAFAFLTMQLKRFNREELKMFLDFCSAVIQERENEKPLDLSSIIVDTTEKEIDIIEISDELIEQFRKR